MATVNDILRALQRAKAAGDTEAAALIRKDLIEAQRASDRAEYDPSKGMSGFEQARAGFGKAFVDLGRGAQEIGADVADMVSPEERNLSGLITGQQSRGDRLRAQQDEQRALDAPLMNHGMAKVGNLAGSIAATAPAMFVPGANTLAGAGLAGAVTGALQPVGKNDSRTGNMLTGAVAAPAAILAGRGAVALGEGAKSLIEPLTQAGQQRIAARVLQSFAGENPGAVASELSTAASPLPGYTMTAAQAVDNQGLAQLERTLRNNPQLAQQWGKLDAGNREAILNSIRGIAKTPGELDAATAARDATAGAMYGAARKEGADAASVIRANAASQRAAAGFGRSAAQDAAHVNLDPEYGVTLFGPGQRAAYEAAKAAEARGTSGALLSQAQQLEQDAVHTGKGFVGSLDVRDLLRRPAIREALSGAETTAANFGESVDQANPVSLLHWAKINLDGKISAAVRAGDNTEASALRSAQSALLSRLQEISPTYKAAAAKFAEDSGPINRMEVGQALLNKLEPALSQASDVGTTGLTPASFARAVQDGESVVRRSTGLNRTLDQILTPDEQGAVKGALNALARRERVLSGGRATGSNTAQNMVAQNVLRSFLGPTGLPQGMADRLTGNALSQSLARGVTLVAKPAEEGVLNALLQGVTDPKVAAELLKQASKPSVMNQLLKRWEATRIAPTSALLLANSAQQ